MLTGEIGPIIFFLLLLTLDDHAWRTVRSFTLLARQRPLFVAYGSSVVSHYRAKGYSVSGYPPVVSIVPPCVPCAATALRQNNTGTGEAHRSRRSGAVRISNPGVAAERPLESPLAMGG